MIYKKHEITTGWLNDIMVWFVDNDRKIGYRSGKDARAAISGLKPRWPVVVAND